MAGFETLLYNLEKLGFFQFLFPFLLILAIVYGVLNFSLGNVLPRSANGLISIIVAMFAMLFAASNPGIVEFLTGISGGITVIGSVFLFIVVLLALFGIKVEDVFKGEKTKYVTLLAIIAIAIALFLGAGGTIVPGISVDSDVYTIVFFLIVLVIAVWWLSGTGEKEKGGEG